MDVIRCATWGARLVNTSRTGQAPALGVTVHHTTSPNVLPDADPAREKDRCFKLARAIQRDHIDHNGWADSGQNFTVCRSGLILEGRHGSLDAAQRGHVIHGAHAGDNMANITTNGIENEGNTDLAPLTEAQWAALVDLIAHLSIWGRWNTQLVYPHQHWVATDCPGHWLISEMANLRAAAHDRKLALMKAAGLIAE